MLLFLRSCAVAASCCATSPLLNSTRSISFNAVLSLCYSVKGHAIGICHQCVPSWCLALTAHSPIFSVALPPGLSGYTPEVLHLRKAICAFCLYSNPLSLISFSFVPTPGKVRGSIPRHSDTRFALCRLAHPDPPPRIQPIAVVQGYFFFSRCEASAHAICCRSPS